MTGLGKAAVVFFFLFLIRQKKKNEKKGLCIRVDSSGAVEIFGFRANQRKRKERTENEKKNERTAIALGSDDDEVFLGASGQFQFALVAVRDAVGAADFVAGQLRQHCGVVFVLFCFVFSS